MSSLNLIISIYLLIVLLTHYCFVLQMKYFPLRSRRMIEIRETKPWILFIPAMISGPVLIIGYFVIFCLITYTVIITGTSYKSVMEMYKEIDKKNNKNNP